MILLDTRKKSSCRNAPERHYFVFSKEKYAVRFMGCSVNGGGYIRGLLCATASPPSCSLSCSCFQVTTLSSNHIIAAQLGAASQLRPGIFRRSANTMRQSCLHGNHLPPSVRHTITRQAPRCQCNNNRSHNMNLV